MTKLQNWKWSHILTLSRLLNGALLSSCSRFPMMGRADGPGGKRCGLRDFWRKSQSKTRSSPADISVTEVSMSKCVQKCASSKRERAPASSRRTDLCVCVVTCRSSYRGEVKLGQSARTSVSRWMFIRQWSCFHVGCLTGSASANQLYFSIRENEK